MSRSTGKKNHSRVRNKATINFDSASLRAVMDESFNPGPIEWELLTKGYFAYSKDGGETWHKAGLQPVGVIGNYGESPLARFRREAEKAGKNGKLG